ncbi:MAG: selenocysteine-specific translation elongation factor [Thermoanaerobaculaceae bacterium]
MRSVVFATAGHIDHGKTSLVAALTGVWCDRLKEEQERGMTLVLGFAPLVDPLREVEVSFVDVPGHERLIHTMLAGAGAVDRILLVVAADEGIMPQTKEHVALLELLGIRGGVVALTKADKVSPELLLAKREEVASFLSSGPLAEAPIIPCSTVTGEGIEELRQAILAIARQVTKRAEPHRPFRLGVDRVFSLAGAGTVVTGTAFWGKLEAGQKLVALPSGKAFRVRSLQVHGETRNQVIAGERVAIALAGAKVEEIPRGSQLLTPGPWEPSTRLLAEIKLLPEGAKLQEGQRLWLFLLTARVPCLVERLSPALGGNKVRAVLRLAQPLFVAPGDRLVLRRPSPPVTVGGGPVLDSQAKRWLRKEAAGLAQLPVPWVDLPGCLRWWAADAGPSGITVAKLAGRLGVKPEGIQAALGQLLAEGTVVITGPGEARVVAASHLEQALAMAKDLLQRAGALGMTAAHLLQRLGIGEEGSLRSFYVQQLKAKGIAREERGYLIAAQGETVENPSVWALEELYRQTGFAAPSTQEAARALHLPPKAAEGFVNLLLRRGKLARVGGKWILHKQTLDDLVQSLYDWGRETFTVGEFKERFGLTRKLAIPILEWLDSQRITRREGETRKLLART